MSTTGAHVPDDGAGGGAAVAIALARPRRPGWWWWQRRRSFVLDVTLAAVSAIECSFEGATFADRTGILTGAGALLGVLVGAVLVLRRRWPVAVVLVSIAMTPAQMGFMLSLVGLYTLAASEVPRRITAALAGMNGFGTMLVAFLQFQDNLRDPDSSTSLRMPLALSVAALMALGLTGPPVLLGLYVRARRRLVESLRERADGLERELELLAEKAAERAERARAEERTRIARDMHDVVAHRVSLMVVHAAALKAVALKDPQKASASAELLGDMGRQALTELRQMLGVLRTAAVPVPAPAAATAAAAAAVVRLDTEAEGPSLALLAALVEESQAAGMCVELAVEGAERPCGARIEATVYRVVQEALTNVHKHAAGAKAVVLLAYREAEVAVLVTNGPSDGSPQTPLPSGGHGLMGMRERVMSHGGGFAAGPTADGGFRVSAMVPLRGGA
ncbi:histidine kinase [Streptomyces cocklensis]|uniref:histidine kinase n=1 Tax=Actinacidiphila cocklensis TaxID=887465 RepID=A0A9W4E579_9ACTN|nr:sensor histidine kinase [Actinacidiphila cocklensis]MDD1057338.1 histidine kinase [Actinacidiphila cocklensis]WSX79125.1 histidine kinase [Streptomyces sp. NBC_00899]CAG6399380.1 Signal transduction histidine kinase [Actinacidiphila cocklensis]